ncbi:MAG: YceD family protein [Micrococcales bacterium]
MATASPFSIKVHDLMHRPGAMRENEIDITLDETMGDGAMTIAAGSVIELDLRLESVHEGILATGEVFTKAVGECSRCLDALNTPVEVDFQELFAYSGTEEDDFKVSDEQIDLESVIRDAIVLSLPFQPVCSPDCPGLCPDCGVKLAENPNHAHDQQVDSRWTELLKFKEE